MNKFGEWMSDWQRMSVNWLILWVTQAERTTHVARASLAYAMQWKIVMLIVKLFKDLQNNLTVFQHRAGMLKYIIVKGQKTNMQRRSI